MERQHCSLKTIMKRIKAVFKEVVINQIKLYLIPFPKLKGTHSQMAAKGLVTNYGEGGYQTGGGTDI